MEIRKGLISDIPEIIEILSEVIPLMNQEGNYQWNQYYPSESDFLKDISDGVLYVVEDTTNENCIAGFAAITTDQPREYSTVGLNIQEMAIVPHRLAVSPKQRGKGVAQLLMKKSELQAIEKGYTTVRVDTNEINTKMNSLFLKLDYKYCGQVQFEDNPDEYKHFLYNCYVKYVK